MVPVWPPLFLFFGGRRIGANEGCLVFGGLNFHNNERLFGLIGPINVVINRRSDELFLR